MSLGGLLDWFAGGSRRYMTLYHCMNHDTPWVVITVALDLAIAGGYTVIALHWWRQQRSQRKNLAVRALANMKNIFIFCGICGYLFIPIKMFWPAWRLYDLFLAILAFYTWRYAWSSRQLKVIYDELTISAGLREDVARLAEESRRKTVFLSALSHDLRTPLNGISLQAQAAELTLEELGADSPEARELAESLANIRAAGRSAAEMLDSFLEIGRLDLGGEPNRETSFALREVLDQGLLRYREEAARKGIALRCECPSGLRVRTDRAKLDRLVQNLAGNAVKYTRQGEVRIEAEPRRADVTIHVVDTGIGIAPEDLTRIFDEFFQVNNSERDPRRGFGLGLPIARRLAGQLGAELSVASTVGRGSRFTLVLREVLEPAVASARPDRGGRSDGPGCDAADLQSEGLGGPVREHGR